ncbi:MAG: hypothetical protein GEU87_02445 [Alphaproteobacteria bacterium]|nr:hypothetical protein [Alphaproteobacteria bacterium]
MTTCKVWEFSNPKCIVTVLFDSEPQEYFVLVEFHESSPVRTSICQTDDEEHAINIAKRFLQTGYSRPESGS